MDVSAFERMISDTARIETLARSYDPQLQQNMLDRLRELDRYGQTRDRVRAKKASMALQPAPRQLPRLMLAEWYFKSRLQKPMPSHLDDYAASIGIEDMDKFYDLLAAEYTFC